MIQPGKSEFENDLDNELAYIKNMLMQKNIKYGDSALNPIRVFSKANPTEQLLVRIDDKLSRLKNASNNEDEDVLQDLIGYLLILRIAENRKNK